MFLSNSHDFNLFFTNKGRVYRIKCYEIPESTRQSKGINIANILPLAADEKVTSMIRIPSFEDDKYLIMVTRQGIIKRIALNAYNTARKGGLIALDLNEGDELAWVRMTDGNNEVLIATKKGMAIRFRETDVRAMGRLARGVKAMKLKEGDSIVGMSIIEEDKLILTVSETGYGRLSKPEDYRLQSRGGKGLINYHVEKYGEVAALTAVPLGDDVIIISENGVIIRILASTIRVCSRPSKGVTIMKIKGDNRVVSVSGAPHEDDAQAAENDENAEDPEDIVTDETAEETAEESAEE
jgi:DNA gyrase subunit A